MEIFFVEYYAIMMGKFNHCSIPGQYAWWFTGLKEMGTQGQDLFKKLKGGSNSRYFTVPLDKV